jgi:tetratricopeptide (TPR) repeat protein
MLKFFKFSFLIAIFFVLFTQISAQNQTANDLLKSAEANERAGNYARAVEDYESLARLHPASAFYQVKLAENYLRLERDSEAIAAARKAIELEPKNPLAHFYLGKTFFELGQWDESAPAFQKASELDAKFADAFYFLGLSEIRRGANDKGLIAMRQALNLSPESAGLNAEFGQQLNSASRFEEAIEPLRKADKLRPNTLEIKVGLGLALFESTRFDEALEVLAAAERMQPGHQVITMFMNVARARRSGAAQLEMIKQYVADNPKDVQAQIQLANVYGFLRRHAEAEKLFLQALKAQPNDEKLYNLLGVFYSDAKQPEKAAAAYQKAISIAPHATYYLSLGSALNKLGRTEEALEASRKALEMKPDSIFVLKFYADLLREAGKRREALEMYKRAYGVEPTNAPVIFNLGVLSAKTGDLESAKRYQEILKAFDPQMAKMLARFLRLKI